MWRIFSTKVQYEAPKFELVKFLIEARQPTYCIALVSGWAFTNQIKMTDEIKRLKKELKEWKSQEVKERFERVNSQLHLVTINELEHKIKRLKRGEDI